MEGYSSLKFQYWVNQICSDPERTKGDKEEKNLSKGRGDRLSLQAQGTPWLPSEAQLQVTLLSPTEPRADLSIPLNTALQTAMADPLDQWNWALALPSESLSSPAGIISQYVELRYRLWKEVKGIWLKCLPQNHPETHNLSLNPFGGESLPWIP